MSAFSDQLQKFQQLISKRDSIASLSQLQQKQQLEPYIDILLKEDEFDIKNEQTIKKNIINTILTRKDNFVFGYIVKKAVKVEKDFMFMTKFLNKIKFFKELKEGISDDLYNDMLKKLMWQSVEPNEFLFSKILHIFFLKNEDILQFLIKFSLEIDKKKSKVTNNFYIIIDGEVMEFQELQQEVENLNSINGLQRMVSNNHLDSAANISQNNLDSPKNNAIHLSSTLRMKHQNSKDKSFESQKEDMSYMTSKRNSISTSPMSKLHKDSLKQLNHLDDTMKQAISGGSTPRGLKRQDSCVFIDKGLVESENQFIKNVNDYLEHFKNDKRIFGELNINSQRFLNLTSKVINAFKHKLSPLGKKQHQLFGIQRQESKKGTVSKFQLQLFKQKQDSEQNQREESDSPLINSNFGEEDQDLLLEMAKNFISMKLRKILKIGESFGEFDDGNLNLIGQGYMSKKKSYLVYLSCNHYNEIIQKHQTQQIEKKIRFLQQFTFFKGYSIQKMKNYLKYFQNATYYRNNIVYQELDPANFIYFITSGEIEFSRLFKFENYLINNDLFQQQKSGEEKIIPLSQLNAQDFELAFNPFEKQEKEMYSLNMGKQFKEKSKLIKRIHSFVLGPNQYFGEKEVLTNSFRLTQAKVESVKLEVLVLPKQIYYEQFFNPDIHELCLQESQLREIQQIKIYNQIQNRSPILNIVEKLEQDYLEDFVKNNSKQKNEQIDAMMANSPSHVPFAFLKKKLFTQVPNYKDQYMTKKEFQDQLCTDQQNKVSKYMKEIRSCKIQFLSKFMKCKSQLTNPNENFPFFDQIKSYVDSIGKQQQDVPLKKAKDGKIRDMLNFCKSKTNSIHHTPKSHSKTVHYQQSSPKEIQTPKQEMYIDTDESVQNLDSHYLLSNRSIKKVNTKTTQIGNFMNPKSSMTTPIQPFNLTKRSFSQVCPLTISKLNFSRKDQFQYSHYQFEETRKHSISQSISSEVQFINKLSPSLQSVKKQFNKSSMQNSTPNSVSTATTRMKNTSRGSMFSSQGYDFAQMTMLTNSDSCKDDLHLERQFSLTNTNTLTKINPFTDRRYTNPAVF